MSNAITIIRSLIIYSLCLPLAIFLGYLLAMPMDSFSFTFVVVAALLPLLPILLRWHHWILFACWNSTIILFFLPGRLHLWVTMALLSFGLSVLQHILNRNIKFVSVPSLNRPFIFLIIVLLVTAKLTGGLGTRLLGGDSFGGKRYFLVLAAIIGYFAMSCHHVPKNRAPLIIALFYLGTLTSVVGSVGPMLVGQSFYFIFALFPVDSLSALYGGDGGSRLSGLTFAATAAIWFLFAQHGIKGLFTFSERWHFLPFRLRGGFGFNQPWRFIVFLALLWICLMGGFRSTVILLGLTFLLQFYLEGLYRTQLLPALVLGCILAGAACLPITDRLPLTVQRSLAFLPVRLDPVARYAAESTTEWRVQMWRMLLPQIPQYLILGKGYSIDPAELQGAADTVERTGVNSAEGAMISGDYHNGPLTVIIPLGIFGVIGFLWLLIAGFRVLLNNYRYGDPALRQINTFLLAAFVVRSFYFLVIFGSFYGELAIFTGILGMSVSINGGMQRPAPVTVEKPAFGPLKLARATKS